MALIEAQEIAQSSWVLSGHQAEVLSLAVAPVGLEKCLASGDRDGNVFLWDTEQVQSSSSTAGGTEGDAVPAQANNYKSGPPSLKNLSSIPGRGGGGPGTALTQLVATTDGKLLGSSAGGTGKIWDLATAKPLKDLFKITLGEVQASGAAGLNGVVGVVQNACAIEPNTGVSVFGGDDRTLRFFSEQLPIATVKHQYPITSLAMAGTLVYVGGPDGLLHCYDLAQRDWLFHAEAHQDLVCSISVSSDRKQVATRGYDGGMMIWDLPQAAATVVASSSSAGNGAKKKAAPPPRNLEPEIFAGTEVKPSREWRLPRLCWGPGDGWVATGELKELHVYNSQQAPIKDLGCMAVHNGEIVDVAVAKRSNLLFCSSSDKLITANLFAQQD